MYNSLLFYDNVCVFTVNAKRAVSSIAKLTYCTLTVTYCTSGIADVSTTSDNLARQAYFCTYYYRYIVIVILK